MKRVLLNGSSVCIHCLCGAIVIHSLQGVIAVFVPCDRDAQYIGCDSSWGLERCHERCPERCHDQRGACLLS